MPEFLTSYCYFTIVTLIIDFQLTRNHSWK